MTNNTPLHSLETLRLMYDKKSLAHVESVAQGFHAAEVNAHRHLLSILSYLEHTRRYREDAQFAAADFECYLKSRYDMTYSSYSLSKTAYIRYPDVTEAYGVGFVTDAARRCGLDRMEDLVHVIREYDVSEADLSPEDLEVFVQTFAKPKEKQKRTDWKSKYLALAEETNQLRADMDARDAEIARLESALKEARAANRFIDTTRTSADDVIRVPIQGEDPENPGVKIPVKVTDNPIPVAAATTPRSLRHFRSTRPMTPGRNRSGRSFHSQGVRTS